MNVLSLFDGMSCGQIALNRIGIKPAKYYAAEVDKYAITVTQANYPDTIQVGDVTKWRDWDIDWGDIDLLIGGSPCQGFSFAGAQLAFNDPRSVLFFVFVDILNHIKLLNPNVKFMLENVKMKKEHLAVISEHLGVEPVFINSRLVSAQNRQRYYWCNWEVGQPEDAGILLSDIIESGQVDRDKSHCIDANYYKGGSLKNYLEKSRRQIVLSQSEKRLMVQDSRSDLKKLSDSGRVDGVNETKNGFRPHRGDSRSSGVGEIGTIAKLTAKSNAITTAHAPSVHISGSSFEDLHYRKLTPVECERLQTVPDGYTAHVSNTQRYKMLGNGWTVDVIAHIFKEMIK